MRWPSSKNFLGTLKLLLILLVFFNSCSIKPKKTIGDLTPSEYKSLEKFFRYFLLYESGIYTLLGSKPMTEMHIVYKKKRLLELTQEELKEFSYFELNQDDKNDMLFYRALSSEQREKAILIPGRDFIYNSAELWDQWDHLKNRFPVSERFLLLKRERPLEELGTFDPHIDKILDILFVNVFQTALVL